MKLSRQNILTAIGWNPTGDLGPYTIYTRHRGTPVLYPRAPPKQPPSRKQLYKRAAFTFAGRQWAALDPHRKQAWALAARRARLRISGYNLYTYYLISRDRPAIRTIERQSGLELIPD